jgi:hypothetical protein
MEIFVIVNNFSRVFFDVFPHVKVIDLDLQSAYDIGKMTMIWNVYVTYSMYKMATAVVPSGTILAVHLQKCSHLSNEIRVMHNFLHRKTFMIYFLTFTGKIAKPWFAISLEKKKPYLPALKNFPMLGETNNQFYMVWLKFTCHG